MSLPIPLGTPENPADYVKHFFVDASKISSGDLEKAWFLHRICCRQLNPGIVYFAALFTFPVLFAAIVLAIIGTHASKFILPMLMLLNVCASLVIAQLSMEACEKRKARANVSYISWLGVIFRNTLQKN